jgi:hypothetical protein
MKSKIIILLAGAAAVTLSFTFASTSQPEKEVAATTHDLPSNAPAGGFALEEK